MPPELIASIARNALGLALFAAVTVGVVAVTHVATRDRIERQQAAADASALMAIAPEGAARERMLDARLPVADPRLGYETPRDAYVVRARADEADAPLALLVPVVAPDGYSGAIRLIVGIHRNGRLTGVRVLEHRETPGLGDQIEARKSDWIESFRGRSLGAPPAEGWTVKPDGGTFDAFTGATITPRAVVRAVYRALEWFEDEGRARLLAAGEGGSQDGASGDGGAHEGAAYLSGNRAGDEPGGSTPQ